MQGCDLALFTPTLSKEASGGRTRLEPEEGVPAALQQAATNATTGLWRAAEVLSGRTGSPEELQGEFNGSRHGCHPDRLLDSEEGTGATGKALRLHAHSPTVEQEYFTVSGTKPYRCLKQS